jgi:hypothetical protein
MKVMMKSIILITWIFYPFGLSNGFSRVSKILENMIMVRMKGSKYLWLTILKSNLLIGFLGDINQRLFYYNVAFFSIGASVS